MLNHNLNSKVVGDILVPDFLAIDTTNSLDSITADANGCLAPSESNSKPNFVMLDFVTTGDGVKAVDQFNGF